MSTRGGTRLRRSFFLVLGSELRPLFFLFCLVCRSGGVWQASLSTRGGLMGKRLGSISKAALDGELFSRRSQVRTPSFFGCLLRSC
ncbi:hypothetical protein B0J13DRAFT_565483 [Dactylonectria estremocensis]|uniref:Uncharacterized protein n=1 Tax=Dactylonectria estremocensis TaxID=1079267 RepID=A0A9P9IL73_9HYPO|nr:hypothetical protein B0J13DRAFT_565483 [Dactylonectria estremocensis]